MLKTNDVVAANKVAQNHGAEVRVLVDQAAVVARQHAALAAQQTVLGCKVMGSYAVGFIRSFVGK